MHVACGGELPRAALWPHVVLHLGSLSLEAHLVALVVDGGISSTLAVILVTFGAWEQGTCTQTDLLAVLFASSHVE
jgi:hypothetical protein